MMSLRNIIIICFISTLSLLNLNAQDDRLIDQQRIDSIDLLIKNIDDNNSEKVRLLNEYARMNIFNLDLIKGFEAASEAKRISEEIGFKEGEILYHKTLATFFSSGDMYTYHIEKARLLTSELDDKMVFVLPEIHEGYPPQVLNESLIQELLLTIDYFKDHENKEILICLNDPIAWYYFERKEIKKTTNIFHQAISFYKEKGELYPVFLHNSYLIFIASQVEDTEEVSRLNEEMKNLVTSIKNQKTIGLLNFQLANYYRNNGDNAHAVENYLQSVDFFKSNNGYSMLANVYYEMSNLYANLEMFDKRAEAMENRVVLIEENNLSEDMFNIYNQALWAMYDAQRYEKAKYYNERRRELANPESMDQYLADNYSLEGHILMDSGQYQEAIKMLEKAFDISLRLNRVWSDEWEAYRIGYCYYQLKEYDKSLEYAEWSKKLLDVGNQRLRKKLSLLFAEIYEARGNDKQAFEYLKTYKDMIKESEDMNVANIVMQAQITSLLEENKKEIEILEKEQLLTEQQNKNQRLWIISIAGALLSALVVSLILYRNNKSRKKANDILFQQKEKVQQTLAELKSTQSQLIQSEKMASLGELTAGIAHEIQNPLNFVKNFSEVSTELIDEMIDDLKSGKQEAAAQLASEIKENQERINHHGKRAGSIVRGMLQHSRISSGELVETDINNLCDEYLRLSYHGLRAKDKSFNADLQTDLAKGLPKVKVVPQDLGRVLLNLINNAFYAVKEKSESGIDHFKPVVAVSTKLLKNMVEIKVVDNGNGVPAEVQEKIFQPFFTTKPSGKGTGLGLSLSYDIIKAHGGNLRVESHKGQGAQFIIEILLNS